MAPTTHEGGHENNVDLTLDYEDVDVAGLNDSTLAMWRHDGDGWSEVAAGPSATVTSFGTVGLFAESAEAADPEEFSSSRGGAGGGTSPGTPAIDVADVTIDDGGVEPGESTTITVEVDNEGDGGGTEVLTLLIDDEQVDARSVFVGAGESTTITFTPTLAEGQHDVAIDDENVGTADAIGQETPTETATEEEPSTATETETPTASAGGAPTPDTEGGSGGVAPLLGVALALVLAAGVVVAALKTQSDR
jgi:hypothetical protein